MLDAEKPTEFNPTKDIRTCRIRGRPGTFYILKLCPRKARVVSVEQSGCRGFLVDKTQLRDLGGEVCQLELFDGLNEPQAAERNNEIIESPQEEQRKPIALPQLPFGILDLDPIIVTDPGPPLRVRCYVRECQEMLRPPTREFKGDVCRHHGIRTHLSGNNPTFTYRNAERNLIVAPRLFSTKLRGNPFKFETHRFGYERSEDCLSWNVFRSLQEAGCLKDVLRFITGLDIHDEPQLYLWGLSMSNNKLEPWPLLLKARERFETRLPVRRPGTEPDISILSPGKCLALIEAKFTSPNTFYTAGHRKDAQSLTMDELLAIYQDPSLKILDVEKARGADRVYYQLWRNMMFSEYMAQLDSPHTQAFHASLVRAGYEHESTTHFRQLVRPEFTNRFVRFTWENIYTLVGLHSRQLSRLMEYMACKTDSLVPAFQLDLW